MKNKQLKPVKYKRNKIVVVRLGSLILLTIALTFLSLKAQYQFWNELFDQQTAIIASSVFEVLRLSALYILLKWKAGKRIPGLLIYLFISLFCGIIAITSWYAEILDGQQKIDHEIQIQIEEQIHLIKTKYTQTINEKIVDIKKNMNWSQIQLAKNQNSQYWQACYKNFQTQLDSIIAQRNRFLASQPENPKVWIEQHTALLNLEFSNKNIHKNYSPIENALLDTWYLKLELGRKLSAIVFVVAIEIGIFLLAFITHKEHQVNQLTYLAPSVLNHLIEVYDVQDIIQFFKKINPYFSQNRELPQAADLSPKLRSIRQFLITSQCSSIQIQSLIQYFTTLNVK